MEESIMKCVTKGNSSPNGKARVYFTCHPDDFDKYFDKVCADIFKTHDPAIYYTPDMTAEFEEENKETDLGRSNLFVIPVTYKLLTEKNRAMDRDFPYAVKNRIPVLPLMMETGLDELYSDCNKFSELQYLNPFSTDHTEISYEDKLKKFLNTVLIGDELAERVRNAFDAYIFLSYRKKDRRYANELMRLIHNNPEFTDIAIWFDEFLSPGESFTDNIEKSLKNSKLFALLVTPNLLEEPFGKPNFVMEKEYPAALSYGMKILPAEMEKTNKGELLKKFDKLPSCVKPKAEQEMLKRRLVNALSLKAKAQKENTPEHNFLIGIAYLEGIDVEVDRNRGLDLIRTAAMDKLPEAMEMLRDMCRENITEGHNRTDARFWAGRIYEYYNKVYGEESPETLNSLKIYADILIESAERKSEYRLAFELSEKAYTLCCNTFGAEHEETLSAFCSFAASSEKVLEYKESLSLFQKACMLCGEALGEEHPVTMTSINNYADFYYNRGKYRKALVLYKNAYSLRVASLGKDNPDTLRSLDKLADACSKTRQHKKALELREKEYPIYLSILGESHPDTLTKLHNLAMAYGNAGKKSKAVELFKEVYDLRCKYLGEREYDTLKSLSGLSTMYMKLGKYAEASKLQVKGNLAKKPFIIMDIPASLDDSALGDEDRAKMLSLLSLADTYGKAGEKSKAVEIYENMYTLCSGILGPGNMFTQSILTMIYLNCLKFHMFGKAHKYYLKLYLSCFNMIGDLRKDLKKKTKKKRKK